LVRESNGAGRAGTATAESGAANRAAASRARRGLWHSQATSTARKHAAAAESVHGGMAQAAGARAMDEDRRRDGRRSRLEAGRGLRRRWKGQRGWGRGGERDAPSPIGVDVSTSGENEPAKFLNYGNAKALSDRLSDRNVEKTIKKSLFDNLRAANGVQYG